MNDDEIRQGVVAIVRGIAGWVGVTTPAVTFVRDGPAYSAWGNGRDRINVNVTWVQAVASPFGGFGWGTAKVWQFLVGVVAHEFSHLLTKHLHGHAAEHAADGFAAKVLAALRLSAEPFALFLFSTRGGASHPAGGPRMANTEKTWALRTFFPGSRDQIAV